ncbi:transmembrane protein 106A isoform X2 [Betta splendens]|uniref:Transmembrane protein 106A isoform X2 n=1 Tax=Betta splendens TaxID=158456 RepID=A0A9W2XFC7_BETSP|nr:transmembrane protein 106A isoform X2 [Betta splendens]
MENPDGPDTNKWVEKVKALKHFPPYGSMDGNASGETCPTCRGTGRIPRGQEEQLVAVIPCNDVRLRPRRTKLYMCVSMGACLFICCLILYFLFPRSVTLLPVSVQSVMVYFTPENVEMEVKNLMNVTNHNFVHVQLVEFDIQGLIDDVVVGKNKVVNLTSVPWRSQKSYTIPITLVIVDEGIRMTMNISYLSHTEQVSVDSFEYVDCGSNSTTPHPVAA